MEEKMKLEAILFGDEWREQLLTQMAKLDQERTAYLSKATKMHLDSITYTAIMFGFIAGGCCGSKHRLLQMLQSP